MSGGHAAAAAPTAAGSKTVEEALKRAREMLASQKFFDGVQVINNVLEAYETRLKDELADLPAFEPMDILRVPEAFLKMVMPKLSECQKQDISSCFAARAELLNGLGVQKRAFIDIAAAELLTPDDESLNQIKGAIALTSGGAAGKVGDTKTPVTIITGFLGAGKTTLLNNILQEHHGKRIAVIENEFGEVGIDNALLNSKASGITEENIIEMNNGCICCTVRGDLIAGLKKLHKQTTGKGKPLDGIIIETTGLADPAPVAQTFFADDFVQKNMTIDGILTVVDALHITQHLKEVKPDGIVNEAVEQVAFADRLLLNKTDLVSEKELEDVIKEIRIINKTAAIKRTQMSKIDMDFIMGIQAFSLDKILDEVDRGFLEGEDGHTHGDGGDGHGHGGHNAADAAHGAGHECSDDCDHHGGGGGGHGDHGDGHGAGHGSGGHDEGCTDADCNHASHKTKKHQHDYRVSSVGFNVDGEMQKDKLDSFISWLMQEKGPDLYRSKGVLAVKGTSEKFVFQAVHMQFGGRNQGSWAQEEKRCCKMVFIGKNLNREELRTKFDECMVK